MDARRWLATIWTGGGWYARMRLNQQHASDSTDAIHTTARQDKRKDRRSHGIRYTSENQTRVLRHIVVYLIPLVCAPYHATCGRTEMGSSASRVRRKVSRSSGTGQFALAADAPGALPGMRRLGRQLRSRRWCWRDGAWGGCLSCERRKRHRDRPASCAPFLVLHGHPPPLLALDQHPGLVPAVVTRP